VIRTLVLGAVLSAAAQAPAIGDINLYGLHKISAEHILKTLDIRPGGPLPPSKGELEDALEQMPGIVRARVEAVCCEGSRAILFIGIEERGAPHAAFRSDPSGDAVLPSDLVDAYHGYLSVVQRLAQQGAAGEDLSAGHSRMKDSEASAFQDRFADFAEKHLSLLRDVLRHGSEAEQRAIAAFVIGYAPRKQDVVNDLQYALQDPDEAVRSNAARALKAIAVLASREPGLGIRISPTWFIELLHSVVLSDRVEAVSALLTLTDHRDPATLELIRDRALDEIVEMARWATPRYALPPFLLVGRVAGLTDDQILQSWEKGDRNSVIDKALAAAGRKRG
jgi:hypothetical protein